VQKILIIGSNGFIGSHLIKYFLGKKIDATGCDIKFVSDDPYPFILLSPEIKDFTELLRTQTYDYCINASGSASVPFSITNPAEDFHLNVANVNLILHAIRNENPSCGFINFSSAAVYGNPSSLPIKENAKLGPISPYGFHKMISEQICTEFWKLYHIRTCSLRVFSAYGPGLRKQLFWDLFKKLKTGNAIELFGTGNESRDFINIVDLCKAVNCIISNAPMQGEVINVASGIEISVRTAVDTFIKEYNPSVKFRFTGEEKPGDPINWRADISMLKKLDFVPNIMFPVGVKNLVEWIKNEL